MQIRKESPPCGGDYLLYWLFFAGSLDGLDEELELDGVEDEPVAPLPEDDLSLDDLSLDELSLEDEAGGVALLLEAEPLEAGGVALLLEPDDDGLDGELVEPEAEPLLDGEDGDVAEPLDPPGLVGLDDEPLELDVPLAPLPLEPRSHPARATPSAMDTAAARIETFILPP